ncbi:hypothetical protein V6N11_072369 [Hibiscus sabdariffa]|uniref:Uncharacterized protein n=1 Tax=Hibiscus sabdariffa TaxID=183260 RepID=A0ABR2U3J4_9ROSI
MDSCILTQLFLYSTNALFSLHSNSIEQLQDLPTHTISIDCSLLYNPPDSELVELRPGQGTLMADLLQCCPALRKLQHQSLKCTVEDSTAEGVDKRSQSALATSLVSWRASLGQVPFPTGCIITIYNVIS